MVAASLQDAGSAHLVASCLSSMPQLPEFNQSGRIQYGSIDGSPHQGQPVNESDNVVVLNWEDFDFLSHPHCNQYHSEVRFSLAAVLYFL